MKKIYLLILFGFFSSVSCAQENCTNGIDDDGDGLIDLQDSECGCTCITTTSDNPSLFSNKSFELNTGCPAGFNEDELIVDWFHDVTDGTSDYLHSCGTVYPFTSPSPLLSFPDGNGVMGTIMMNNYNEYFGAKLINPLIAGIQTTLQINLAAIAFNNTTNVIFNDSLDFLAPNIEITIWGSLDTLNPTHDSIYEIFCLPYTNWEKITQSFYVPKDKWEELSFSFVPNKNYRSIILGAPCTYPSGYTNYTVPIYTSVPYFLWDNARLNYSTLFDSEITTMGSWCTNDFKLVASIDTSTISYQWYLNQVALTNETDSIIDVMNYGIGEYTVVFHLDSICQQVSFSVDTASNMFIPQFSVQSDTVCSDVDFQVSISGNADYYLWESNNEVISTQNGLQPTFNIDTTTVFTITGFHSGCFSDTVITFDVIKSPSATFNSFDTICSDESYNFQFSCADYTSFNFNCITNNSIIPILIDSTTFEINSNNSNLYLFTVNNFGCIFQDTFHLTEINAAFSPNYQVISDSLSAPASITFLNTTQFTSNDSFEYYWDFGNGEYALTKDENSVSTIYQEPGTYIVTLTVTNNGFCLQTFTDTITVLKAKINDISIPNIFTPNSDDINDLFTLDISNLLQFELQIYNRWGNRMTTLNMLHPSWDGNINGKRVSDGIYFYRFSGITKDAEDLNIQGNFQLLR